jgi:hypothetical protein
VCFLYLSGVVIIFFLVLLPIVIMEDLVIENAFAPEVFDDDDQGVLDDDDQGDAGNQPRRTR